MKDLFKFSIFLFIYLFSIQTIFGQDKKNTFDGFSIGTKDLNISFDFYNNQYLRCQTILPDGFNQTTVVPNLSDEDGNVVFLQCTGENQASHHGTKLTGGNPGMRLLFVEKKETITTYGKQVIIIQRDTVKKLRVESYYEFDNASPTVREYTKIINEGAEDVGIEYLSSAILNNYSNITPGSPEENIRIHYAYNSWQSEAQWHTAKPSELGWNENGLFNLTGVIISNLGSWSTIRYLPMGMIENIKAGITWFWQIEHNGSWYSEMSNTPDKGTYLYLGGPDDIHSHALKILKPGESYQTVPVALGCVKGGFGQAVKALTEYRRAMIIKPNNSYKTCPVIFNDYMNCLWANPTTENELPLIDAAAKAGCNYFVIDAGWYAEKDEGPGNVGLWQPSKSRFIGGLNALLNKIKEKGMIPGLWLEPEMVGINSPIKDKPDNWFLMLHGKRYIDDGSYMLDFRNPEVIDYITSVVDRLVKQYGVGYIKMDYNSTAWGADGADSPGQGLLELNRAVLKWEKDIGNKYPQLIIENCASGGCRMDYAMLSETQLQSSSDQSDYKKYPAILVGEMAAVVPEQLLIWSYPISGSDAREASFNMVNAMLCRICLSGNLDKLSKGSFEVVRKGIEIYKTILAPVIHKSLPFFPLGMPSITDDVDPISVGIRNGNKEFIAVWRLKGAEKVDIPSSGNSEVKLLYPQNLGIKVSKIKDKIQFDFPKEYMAAIIEISK
ncbi:MAG: glycoside hydrolase family 36 protein [Ignavibacteriaceae bacterium]